MASITKRNREKEIFCQKWRDRRGSETQTKTKPISDRAWVARVFTTPKIYDILQAREKNRCDLLNSLFGQEYFFNVGRIQNFFILFATGLFWCSHDISGPRDSAKLHTSKDVTIFAFDELDLFCFFGRKETTFHNRKREGYIL